MLLFDSDLFQELEELTASYKYKSEKLEDCEKALEELGGQLLEYVTTLYDLEFSSCIFLALSIVVRKIIISGQS